MATTSGTLVSKVSSTASSPTVNYSAAYKATRTNSTTKSVSVKVDFSAWLNSSGSFLGTGAKLTIYARINGGSWSSVTIKSTSATWNDTAKHNASITLTGNTTSNSAKIDFYVTRYGSTYSGTAGNLGSSSSPKSYTATLPTYSATTYSVTYSASGDVPSGYIAPTDNTAYNSGATVTVKVVPSADGYSFNGWLLNGIKATSFKITANTTLTGVWSKLSTDKYVYVKVSGVWKKAIPYIKKGGTWHKTIPYVKISGVWKST